MNTEQYIELDWEAEFNPVFGSPIQIPVNTILWRGYDKGYPSISERPTYYSSEAVATGYANKTDTHVLGTFMTTRILNVIDIRFMRALLMRLIEIHYDDKYIDDFATLMLSFGLCSLYHQISLLKKRYTSEEMKACIRNMEHYYKPGFIEQQGVRVAETTNDGHSMIFLRELFKHNFDGFISPRMKSPFHIEKNEQIHPELILFNPTDASIVELSNYPKPIRIRNVVLSGTTTMSLRDLLKDKRAYHISSGKIHMKFIGAGNKTSGGHPLDKYDELVRTNKEYQKNEKKIQAAGRKWSRKAMIVRDLSVTFPVVPWPKTFDGMEDIRQPIPSDQLHRWGTIG